MKLAELLRHLQAEGCGPIRDRGKHTVFFNPANGRISSVPRHREVDDSLARKICRDLGISQPRKRN